MVRDVSKAAPGYDEAAIVLGCDFGREGREEFAVGAEERRFKEDTLKRRRISGRDMLESG